MIGFVTLAGLALAILAALVLLPAYAQWQEVVFERDCQKVVVAEHEATVEAQRRLLEVQLEMATTAGDQAGIERLQAALAAWDAPIPVGQPVERPVPTNPGR